MKYKLDRNKCICKVYILDQIENEYHVLIIFHFYIDIKHNHSIVVGNFYILLQIDDFPLYIYIRDIITFHTHVLSLNIVSLDLHLHIFSTL